MLGINLLPQRKEVHGVSGVFFCKLCGGEHTAPTKILQDMRKGCMRVFVATKYATSIQKCKRIAVAVRTRSTSEWGHT